MIIFLPDPQELINTMEFKEVIQIKLPSGGLVNAEPLSYDQMRVINVVSTDPMDYMHQKYQPGEVITHRLAGGGPTE
ncbi:MAG: YlzJ-like family protein [Syntrophomonas sp.]